MRKPIPRLLWLSIAVLGIMAVYYLVIGLKGLSANATLSPGIDEQGQQSLGRFSSLSILALFAAVLSVVMLVGLVLGRTWGYVLTLAFVLLQIPVAYGRSTLEGITTTLILAPVVVPVLICTRFFFARRMSDTAIEE